MTQLDFIGGLPAPKPFKDIRNTRPGIADEKATLLLQLGRLIRTVPASVRSGSVDITRKWRAAQEKGIAVAKNTRASISDMTAAIANLRRFE